MCLILVSCLRLSAEDAGDRELRQQICAFFAIKPRCRTKWQGWNKVEPKTRCAPRFSIATLVDKANRCSCRWLLRRGHWIASVSIILVPWACCWCWFMEYRNFIEICFEGLTYPCFQKQSHVGIMMMPCSQLTHRRLEIVRSDRRRWKQRNWKERSWGRHVWIRWTGYKRGWLRCWQSCCTRTSWRWCSPIFRVSMCNHGLSSVFCNFIHS